MTDSCFHCMHWQKALGLKHDTWSVTGVLREARAVGAGHCEHPLRPRGLTLTVYKCADYSDSRIEPAPMVDVTPKAKQINPPAPADIGSIVARNL
jgi:hypothetical protein